MPTMEIGTFLDDESGLTSVLVNLTINHVEATRNNLHSIHFGKELALVILDDEEMRPHGFGILCSVGTLQRQNGSPLVQTHLLVLTSR